MRVIMETLGHSQVSLTLNTYPARSAGTPGGRSGQDGRNLDIRELEPRGQLVAAAGGHSSGRLTADDPLTVIP